MLSSMSAPTAQGSRAPAVSSSATSMLSAAESGLSFVPQPTGVLCRSPQLRAASPSSPSPRLLRSRCPGACACISCRLHTFCRPPRAEPHRHLCKLSHCPAVWGTRCPRSPGTRVMAAACAQPGFPTWPACLSQICRNHSRCNLLQGSGSPGNRPERLIRTSVPAPSMEHGPVYGF